MPPSTLVFDSQAATTLNIKVAMNSVEMETTWLAQCFPGLRTRRKGEIQPSRGSTLVSLMAFSKAASVTG